MRIARAVAVLFLLVPAVGASEPAPQEEEKKRIEDLEKQVVELTRRMKELEERVEALKKATAPAGADPASPALPANERTAAALLKTLATAEADFRANDRDSNGLRDFWVGDVSGLYRYTINLKEIKLIEKSLADADATPLKTAALSALKLAQPAPKAGYLFAALAKYVEKEKPAAYHSGNGRNAQRFGFTAYPAEPGKSGRLTFVISETNLVWGKDLGGKPPDSLPENPAKDGWEKSD